MLEFDSARHFSHIRIEMRIASPVSIEGLPRPNPRHLLISVALQWTKRERKKRRFFIPTQKTDTEFIAGEICEPDLLPLVERRASPGR